MRIPLVIMALVCCLAAASYAATTPGTIVTVSASVSYYDSAGIAMPQQSSNPKSVLVVAKDPENTVYLTIKSLYQGPSTIGRTIKLVGEITTDANGLIWISDGSNILENSSDGKLTGRKLYCRVAPDFLSSSSVVSNKTGRIVIAGISQVDTDNIPVIIPSGDSDIQDLPL
ncbi:MAG: hypothetical protein ABFD64_13730 [Armatimonadota bacterium]